LQTGLKGQRAQPIKGGKKMSVELKQNLKDLQLKFENLRGYL
jgi:hypothetical protein